MAASIRYLCLSDLHLGSESSLLTECRPGCEEPHASDVMRALVECIRSLPSSEDGRKPTLILLGDILEFALAKDEVAAMAFQRLMELTMREGDELFEDVWYVPGNHDHHLWEGARETQYAAYVGWRDPALALEEPWHSTRMLHETDEHKVHSPLLTALLHRARPGASESLSVSAIYPNLGLRRKERCVVFHHGHFIEWPYRLFTLANQYAFGVRPPDHVGDLEADNFAWIDFLWSGLGRCGSAGESIQHAYESLQSAEEKKALLKDLAEGLARSCRNRLPWLPEPLEDFGQQLTFQALLGSVAGMADTMGRKAYYGGADATASHAEGTHDYLATYVLEQVTRECRPDMPSEVSFVLGHTHHPLEEAGIEVEGFARPVRAFNAGGWVHETDERQDKIGASLVVLDDELNVVSIRLYNEVDDMSTLAAEAREPLNAGEKHSELFCVLERLLATDHVPWRRLVDAVDAATR